jgi:predicted amidohydrolase
MRAKKIAPKNAEIEMLEINKKNNLTVALVQMQSQSKVSENFQQAIDFLQEAIDLHNAQLIVFPENFLCMGASDYSAISENIFTYVEEFTKLAKKFSVFILLGSVPIKDNYHKCFSRSLLINSFGLIVGHYDKIHLFDVEVADNQGSYRESDSFSAGKGHCTLPLEFSRLGLSICYDLRFPELYQLLRKDGAKMISVPSAFTYKTGQAHWEILLRARAIETQCYILAANQCGTHYIEKTGLTRDTWGHSMIIDPWGDILCSLQESPGVCSANLDFNFLEKVRNSMNLNGHKRL